jgi:hypothetical protein
VTAQGLAAGLAIYEAIADAQPPDEVANMKRLRLQCTRHPAGGGTAASPDRWVLDGLIALVAMGLSSLSLIGMRSIWANWVPMQDAFEPCRVRVTQISDLPCTERGS